MKQKLYFTFLVLATIIYQEQSACTQKEQTIFFGVNVGVKIANKNHALRYGGGYQNELYYSLINQYNYNELYIRLGDKNFQLAYDGLPANIRYTPSLITGVSVGYQINPNFQMSLDGNFCKLKVRDVFTVIVDDPTNSTSQNVYEIGQLYAEESRFEGRFNLDYVFPDGDKFKLMAGISGIFSAWRIDEHWAMLKDYTMPLFSVHNPNNNILNKTRGIGWGGGFNIGCQYEISEKIISQLVYQPYHVNADYGFIINKKLLLQHDLTLRLMWK